MKQEIKGFKIYPAAVPFLMAAVIGIVVLFSPLRAQETFYVAPNGNDGNPGTMEQPLKSLQGAKAKVRTALDGNGDITVYFRGGTYVFNSTVVFGKEDGGGANQEITYSAYPGETPVFTSLLQVTGWKSYSGNVKQAALPAGISRVRYLQDGAENWMPRSATSMFTPAETSSGNESITYESGGQAGKRYTRYPGGWSAPDWAHASQYDLRITMEAWVVNILPISSVNTGNRRIDVSTPGTYQMKSCEGDCAPAEARVLNTIEGIDAPGEWACLNGNIYLYPKNGTGGIYVPQLVELVRIDAGGDGNTWNGTPVRYIIFDGITFTGGDFYIRQYDYDNPLDSDVTSQHDWGIVDRPAGMFEIRNAADCRVVNCTFEKSGGGLRLDRYAQDIQVYNNTFRYLGREAISLMGRGPGYGDVNKNNEISYNGIVGTGREKWDAPAINLGQASNNHIHHNFIDDTYVSAIIFTSSRGIYVAAKAYEDSDDYFLGGECHYWEVAPVAVQYMIDNIDDGEDPFIRVQKYFYNYNNLMEKNVVTNAHNGHRFYSAYGTPTNGVFYSSGGTHNQTNTVRLNYIYNLSPGDTQFFYQDAYTDNIDIRENMLHNVRLNAEEGVIFDVYINSELPATGRGLVESNVIQDSAYWSLVLGTALQQGGNMDLSGGSPGGGAAYVKDYIEMYQLLCPGNLPGPNPLPGADRMRSRLAAKITAFGGTVPACSSSSQYSLTANTDGSGSITFSPPGGVYEAGTEVTLTATPSAGWQFVSWSGDLSSSSNPAAITMDSDKTVTATFTPGSSQAVISLDREHLHFGAASTGALTGPQELTVTVSGGGVLNWAATGDQSWLASTPSTGTGTGTVSVSVDAAGLSSGIHTGLLTVSAPGAENSPQTLAVILTVYKAGRLSAPFGEFATPSGDAAVAGSIPVTGWALDDIGVESVRIFRGNNGPQTYIGEAVFVENARQDVERDYPDYPMSYRAGWGYMLLTHFLPGGGNGTFKLYAVAADKDGRQVILGPKTIIVDNENSPLPFGAIDTPAQGGTASGGSFTNWGWVLTPRPNSIPTDGTTIDVFVDGDNLGHPVYNNYREDIAVLFPGYANSDGAFGAFDLDTSIYADGTHIIHWIVTDSAGNSAGIGSRYFSVRNFNSLGTGAKSVANIFSNSTWFDMPKIDTPPAAHTEPYRVEIKELERVKVPLLSASTGIDAGAVGGTKIIGGYMVSGRKVYPLPIGSTIKNGFFLWSPGPGFFGTYRLVFVLENQPGRLIKRDVEITIRPH